MPASGTIRSHRAGSPSGTPHTAFAIDAAIRRVRRSSSAAVSEEAVESAARTGREQRTRFSGLSALRRFVPQRVQSAGSWLVHNAGEFVGGAGSYERGFVAAAVVLVFMLGAARLFIGSTPVVGALVPMLALTGILAYRLRRVSFQSAEISEDGEASPQPQRFRKWIDTRWKAALLGIVCAPLLTHVLKPMSPARSHRAFIWTCWLAFLVGSFGMALSAVGATVR